MSLGIARRLSEFFTTDCEAADATSGQVMSGRREITRAVAWARERDASAQFSVEDVELVAQDSETVAARFTLRVDVADGGESELNGTRVDATWVRKGRTWLIESVFVDRAGGSS